MKINSKNRLYIQLSLSVSLMFALGVNPLQANINNTRAVEILSNNSCMGCHKGGVGYGSFTDYQSDLDWVRNGYIVPGDADKSLLIKRIINAGGAGATMPTGGNPALSTKDFQDLKAWINAMNPRLGDNISLGSEGKININEKIGINLSVPQEQLKIYNRCYSHFTRRKLPVNDPAINKIRLGKVKAAEACRNILITARLSGAGGIVSGSQIGLDVLKTFHDLHSSWLPVRGLPERFSQFRGHAYREESSPANFVTRALFAGSGSIPYSSVLTEHSSYKAIRNQGDGSKKIKETDVTFTHNVERLELGRVHGFTSQGTFNINNTRASYFDGNRTNNDPVDIFKNFGGGMLGDQAYLALFGGEKMFSFSNGGSKVTRVMSAGIFKQFLCRDLPVIRPGDELVYMHPERSSALTFRNGNSCMQCHSSMDPLAWSWRNLVHTRSIAADGETQIVFTKKYSGAILEAEAEGSWPESDNNFYKRPPAGKLYYRNSDGVLINKKVISISGLALELTKQNDFYSCTASKYFEFLTGVKVNLEDLGHPKAATLSNKELKYRVFVKQLGLKLKDDQNLENLIINIISSKAYAYPGLGVK